MACERCVEEWKFGPACRYCGAQAAAAPPYGMPPAGYPPPGYQPMPYGQPFYPPQPPGNGLGVAGFVLGLLGLLFFWIPFFGLLMALLGVCLGGAGIGSGRRRGAGIGLAVTGLVLGLVALIPTVFFLIAMLGAAHL